MKGRKFIFNDALNVLYLRLYGVGHNMVKDHSDSERGNPLPPHDLLFPISSKGILYVSSHRQDSTYHGICYTSCGALAGTRNSSMGMIIIIYRYYYIQREREREFFYLTTHSTHFIYGYMASDIWLRTILTVRKETRCRHIGYSYLLTARVLLYAPSHRQDNIYHGLCYTSRGALAETRNSSMGPPHEGSIRRPIALWANYYIQMMMTLYHVVLTKTKIQNKHKQNKKCICGILCLVSAYYDFWFTCNSY